MSGLVVFLKSCLQNTLIEFRLSEHLLTTLILYLKLTQSLGFIGFHTAVLAVPSLPSGLGDLKSLEYFRFRFTGHENRLAFLK